MKADIWMPLYIGDYLADTARLTTEQHGAYLLLIMDYWRSGKLPDDDRVLAQICKMPLDAWSNARASIEHYFSIEDGFWVHARIEAEKVSAKANKGRNVEKAKKAANARWSKAEKDARSNARSMPVAMLVECPSPSPSDNNKTTLSGKPDSSAAKEVLDHLNKKTGKNYQPVAANLHMINARIKEFSVEDCIAVIDLKASEWLSDEKMNQYLRPATLFNAKNFASYQGMIGQSKIKMSADIRDW